MSESKRNHKLRVLYSFPFKIGEYRICDTAWKQVNSLPSSEVDILVHPGVLHRPFSSSVKVSTTLSWGKLRISYKILGMLRACALHDHIVAGRIKRLADQIDIIHCWSLGSLQTLKTANQLGIPTVLERPNAHTRFAYETVRNECDRINVPLPSNHEHAYNKDILDKEEAEYNLAYRLLCPSDFVVKTFLDQGFPEERLVRHIYGFDEKVYYPDSKPREQRRGLTMISVGVCAVRKGQHFALEAWLKSPASKEGTFLIAGEFLPAYAKILEPMLSHPSVKVLGHRNDIPELMRNSDILVLPTIEEGFGLVCTEAMGSGCVPLVSEACTDICKHMENSLVHPIGDVNTLTEHITMVHEDRNLLSRLRNEGLKLIPNITWESAGRSLFKAYEQVISEYKYENDKI